MSFPSTERGIKGGSRWRRAAFPPPDANISCRKDLSWWRRGPVAARRVRDACVANAQQGFPPPTNEKRPGRAFLKVVEAVKLASNRLSILSLGFFSISQAASRRRASLAGSVGCENNSRRCTVSRY